MYSPGAYNLNTVMPSARSSRVITTVKRACCCAIVWVRFARFGYISVYASVCAGVAFCAIIFLFYFAKNFATFQNALRMLYV